MYRSLIVTLIIPLFFICCNKKDEKSQTLTHDKLLENKYATGFSISTNENSVRINLNNPFQDGQDTLSYVLASEISDELRNRQEIELPVKKLGLMASTYYAFLNEMNSTSLINVISNGSYFFSDRVQEGLQKEEIIEVGYGQNIDFEKTILANPQVLIISGMSSAEMEHYSKLSEAGIIIIPISEWRETHPLGRAEWIKVFGALVGKLDQSIQIFNEIEKNYFELLTLVKEVENTPKVIVNAPYKDIWWLPGGNSYMSHLLEDAKAKYPWVEDENTGGIQSDIEAVFYKAGDAEYWINPSARSSLEDLASADARFKEFRSFKNGNVFNNNLRIGSAGGNDYFETGIVRPDLILKDLIGIFHPELNSNQTFYFYQKLK